jgi:DDE superfamily endonuclease
VRRRGGRDRGPGPCAHEVLRAAAPGLAAQNKSLHASERDTARVQAALAVDRNRQASLDCRRLQCVDASGVNLAWTRLSGRAAHGERVVGHVPQYDGENVTLLGTLGSQGLQAVMTVDGATNTEVFRAYVKPLLGPTLASGDIFVMDYRRPITQRASNR